MAATVAIPPDKTQRAAGAWIVDWIWDLFASQRLALLLILVLAVASLAGALLQQVNPDVANDEAAYAAWLLRVRPRFGAWTNVLSTFGLFNVFYSAWYRALLGLLSLNVVVCTANRCGALWRSATHVSFQRQERFFTRAPARASVQATLTPDDTLAALETELRRRRYRVVTDREGEQWHVYADRNRFGKLGTILNHLSLVLILAGAIAGGVWGFRDRAFMVPQGSTRPVGFGTQLSVQLEEFVDEYYPEGPPKDYRSTLVLYDGGQQVKRQVVRVNEPLLYNGVRFHQSFFGPATVIRVTDPDGGEVFDDAVALGWAANGRPAGSFSLPKQGLTVYAVAPASGTVDPLIGPGQVRLEGYLAGRSSPIFMENVAQGQPATIQGLRYEFVRELQFTGLQVVKDPGGPLVWIASALMVLGLVMVFWFPHQRLWALVRPAPAGTASGAATEILLGAAPTLAGTTAAQDDVRRMMALAVTLARLTRPPVATNAT